MKAHPLVVLLSLAIASGCAKKVPLSVAGSDDDLLEQYSAQLEELRTRYQHKELKCDTSRELAQKGCDLSRKICQISRQHQDRPDVEKKCVSSQEECAQWNDRSVHCVQ